MPENNQPKYNPFSYLQGIGEMHQEAYTESINWMKAQEELEKGGIGKGIAKLVTGALIFATTGSLDLAKYGGEVGSWIYDYFEKSEDRAKALVSEHGKYGYGTAVSRMDAVDRYTRQSDQADLIGTGAMIASDFFGSEPFKEFAKGDLGFLEMMSMTKENVTSEIAKLGGVLEGSTDPMLKAIGQNKYVKDLIEKNLISEEFIPNLLKPWDFGGGNDN